MMKFQYTNSFLKSLAVRVSSMDTIFLGLFEYQGARRYKVSKYLDVDAVRGSILVFIQCKLNSVVAALLSTSA